MLSFTYFQTKPKVWKSLYDKFYFNYYGKKVMTYTMVKKSSFKFPTERYLNIVRKGYNDCALDKEYLRKGLLEC